MNYLVIRRCTYGYDIHTSGAAEHNFYFYGYSIRQAEQRFRELFNCKGKHFTKLYI